jgi:hypothetical protein
MAPHGVVVRRGHTRPEEDVVLDRGVCGHVAVALDLDAVPDRDVVVDRATASDDRLAPDARPLPDLRLVAHDRPGAELGAGEDDRPRENRRALPDHGRRRRLLGRCRAGTEARRLADHGSVLDRDPVRDPRARVDHDVRAERDPAPEHDPAPEQQARGGIGGGQRRGRLGHGLIVGFAPECPCPSSAIDPPSRRCFPR